MRLIASFDTKEKAYALHVLLSEQNIENFVEKSEQAVQNPFLVWAYNEEDVEKSLEIVEHLTQNPEALKQKEEESQEDLFEEAKKAEAENQPIKGPIKVRAASYYQHMRSYAPITRWIIILCAILFFWQAFQIKSLKEKFTGVEVTKFVAPLTLGLMYDVPEYLIKFRQFLEDHPTVNMKEAASLTQSEKTQLEEIQAIPSFKGFFVEILPEENKEPNAFHLMFHSIKQGQFWRLFTPALLHGDLLHVLFNMMWLWFLGRQVELKLKLSKYLLLTLLFGIITNTLQYLMSGPFFVGYSGIICGFAGFIWVRQKCAPWEGYNVPKSALVLLLVFILGMLGLQLIALCLEFFGTKFLSLQIGNTAHISGFIAGMIFARIPFLYKVKA